jgi:hypothetical protein
VLFHSISPHGGSIRFADGSEDDRPIAELCVPPPAHRQPGWAAAVAELAEATPEVREFMLGLLRNGGGAEWLASATSEERLLCTSADDPLHDAVVRTTSRSDQTGLDLCFPVQCLFCAAV